MALCVCTLDFLIPISSTTLNSKGAAASPFLRPLLTLSLEDKCLPVLTLTYISVFAVLHKLTNFLGGDLVYAFHSIFPFSIQCHSCLKVNKQMMYICIVFPTFFQYLFHNKKFDQQLIFFFESLPVFYYYFLNIRY
jgi:hypothetical protein